MPPDSPCPSAALAKPVAPERSRLARQDWRRLTQAGFFLLFLLAPALNLLRFDLYEAQLWFLGMRWSLGIDALARGEIDATTAALQILWRAFFPGLALVGGFIFIAYKYGRLYCGWLCPHFSMVEMLNGLLQRACGKLSLWDKSPTPRLGQLPNTRWWPLFGLSCGLVGFVWAITLLTYLLPPAVIWGNLVQGSLTPNQLRFLGVATLLISLELAFARHLFCRFGCAVGYFQSLAWMANPKGMVVAFERERAKECKTCGTQPLDPVPGSSPEGSARLGAARRAAPVGSACDNVCPMRLNPRNIKRMMFSCVQCGQCLDACETSQGNQGRSPTLEWRVGADALRETLRQRAQTFKEDR
ncbi:4Fe-4S binding protein [Rhodoferax sp. U2-2l]|uniref:4Fe-4S binding protein n=1 Tax=Rhodoferax sp. U2-2l TaxID=2884000 RepID=UPI001D0A72E0|nr:4Fe-4S binding protein [Rhodoferax sp. U2-2l]MCB8748847.1 4Fe-4S binding protein [Rhodoferax sp. U2-2l]